jgi:small subunit ribosomal protein S19e
MVGVKDVPADKLVGALKEELKKVEGIKPPAWSRLAKTGVSRERPAMQPDFWYVRSASVLRRIYLNGPVGVEKLRTFYGGRKRRRTMPAKFRKGSGSVIRKIMQQLDAAGLTEKVEKGRIAGRGGSKRGRVLTSKGRKMLDNIAYEVSKGKSG